MWKTSPWMGPIFQMTNLMFGLGLALGPQVVKPFLGYEVYVNISTAADVNVTGQTLAYYDGLHPIQVAYFVLGAMDISMGIILVLTSTWIGISTDQCNSIRSVLFQQGDRNDDTDLIPDESKATSKSVSEAVKAKTQPKKLDACSRPGRIMVTLIFLTFMMNAGRSIVMSGLLYTYLYEYLGWSVQAATSLLSMFHFGSFLIGSIVVFLARWVSPTKLVTFDMVSLLLSSILMLVALFEEDGGACLTTVGVMVATLGESNINPTLISLAAESIDVIAPVMSLFIAAYGVSMLFMGPLSGAVLNFSVVAYPSMLLALVLACILTLVVYYSILYWLKHSGHWPQ